MPFTTVVNGTMRTATLVRVHLLRRGLTVVTSGHEISVSFHFMFLHAHNIALPTCKLNDIEVSNIVYCMVMAKLASIKKVAWGPQFHGRVPNII